MKKLEINKEALIWFAIAMILPFSFTGYIVALIFLQLKIAAVFFVLFASSFISYLCVLAKQI